MTLPQSNYQPAWQRLYEQLAADFKVEFGTNLTACQHIGSTAVPTITATPVVDILLEFDTIPSQLTQQLEKLQFKPATNAWLPSYRQIGSAVSAQLFITTSDSPAAKKAVALRDYLNAHRTDARKYELTKQDNAAAAKITMIHDLTGKAEDWLKQLAAHDAHDRTVRAELVNMCFIYDRQTDQVVVENKIDAKWPGLTLPGGHVDRGESQLAAITREVKEETGLNVSHLQLAGTVSWVENDQGDVTLGTLYRTEHYNGQLLPGSYEGNIRWMPVRELLKSNLAPGIPAILKVYLHPEFTEAFWGNQDTKLHVY